ncbi:hypothetical protein [Bradyrhizobium canariense]|uniref:hypothetical protein n=1 Tax=Bradyrhizobium TaxID=374 RepID=UPI0011775E7E|nr:hypothetical protein [Bradyrhizobium canariense]
MKGLLFLLCGGRRGSRGAVASVPPLVAPGAAFLTPLSASRAAFLSALCSPAAPLLTAFCA